MDDDSLTTCNEERYLPGLSWVILNDSLTNSGSKALRIEYSVSGWKVVFSIISIFSSSLIRRWPWSNNGITVSIWIKFCYLFSTKYHKALHPAWKKYTSHLFPHCILNLDAQALSMLQVAFPTLRWEHISQIELFGFLNIYFNIKID